MKLKSKVVIAMCIIMILPFLMAIICVYMISNYQFFQTQSKYGFDVDTIETIANPIKILDWLTMGSYNDISRYIEDDVDALEDNAVLEQINEDMNEKYAFLIVRKDEEFIYIGNSDKFNKIDKNFPKYENNTGEENPMVYLSGNYPCLVKQLNYKYSDGSKGSAFIVIDVDGVVPQIKTLAIEVVIMVVFVFLITSLALVFWIYRSMLKPINKLTTATEKISSGDLDFSISVDDKDEIGTLCQDFERMRQRLKELIEAQQAYEVESRELISNISHDIKTPLTAIKGYTEGLLDGVADTKEKQEKYLKTIYNKAVDMTALVDELSLYSKIEGNVMPYSFEEINIDNYFGDCIEELTLDFEVKNIELNYENKCDDKTMVYIDPEQIRRVVNNIISNSVKYMDKPKGKLEVTLSDEKEFVKVKIKDNGKGIDKKDQQYIFDRFYRADSSRNSSQGGTGLGLSIAKKIIERHGGEIAVESEKNDGTTIIFTIPKMKDKLLDKDTKASIKKKYYKLKWYNRVKHTKQENDSEKGKEV